MICSLGFLVHSYSISFSMLNFRKGPVESSDKSQIRLQYGNLGLAGSLQAFPPWNGTRESSICFLAGVIVLEQKLLPSYGAAGLWIFIAGYFGIVSY